MDENEQGAPDEGVVEETPLDPLFQFWGILAPIKRDIIWRNTIRTISYHVLTNSEEIDLISRVKSFPEEQRIMREGELRAAYTVDAVDDVPVNWSKNEPLRDPAGTLYPNELIMRANWVHTWPGPLLDAILVNYDLAARQPLLELSEILSDPNIDAERSSNGEPLTGSARFPGGS